MENVTAFLEEQVKLRFNENEDQDETAAKKAIGEVLAGIIKVMEGSKAINNINLTDADMIKLVEAYGSKGYAKRMLVAYFETK